MEKIESMPKLFIPGPTHVPENVLKNLSYPQIGHRTPEFSKLMKEIVLEKIKIIKLQIKSEMNY